MVEYSKENILNLCSELTGLTQDESYSFDNWTYGYKYNHAGVREQKRMLISPHGDGGYGEDSYEINKILNYGFRLN